MGRQLILHAMTGSAARGARSRSRLSDQGSNSACMDPAPLCTTWPLYNLAHYRARRTTKIQCSSAGQPQPWMARLTEEWRGGSKRGIVIRVAGSSFRCLERFAGSARAQPNTLAKKFMDAKEAQMRAIGLGLITPAHAIKTATGRRIRRRYSVLSVITPPMCPGLH